MNEVRLVSGDWATLGADAGRVRTAVFVVEQGIPAELEWDAWDERSLHCVAYVDDVAVATGRLLPDGHIGRMAVLAKNRRSGIGARILVELIGAARTRGDALVELSAQSAVTGFYARHGFVERGDPYDEVGIPHQKMALALAPTRIEIVDRVETMADGSALVVRDWLPQPPPGPARGVYILHGLGEHIGRHDTLARWLAARGWRVRAHDHVGHGRSSGRRGVIDRPEQLVDHATVLIAGYARELGAPPLVLGQSMGAALAAQIVVARGEPVAGLVLCSPALALRMNAFQRMLAALMLRLAPGKSVSNGLDAGGLSHDPAIAQAYRNDPLVHRRVSARLVRWLADAGAQARDAAPTLSVRSLLLAGGDDTLVDPGGSRAFTERAPPQLLTMHWYEALRHELFNEREPDRSRVFDDFERWLQGFDAG